MGNNEMFTATGRYMSGTKVASYHLVGDNGSVIIANRDKAILLISRGRVKNMRVQYSGDDVIIRGNGINLNTLPIFDIDKESFRNSGIAPQTVTNAANNSENTKVNAQSSLSQFKITKRIMYKTACVGYVIANVNGQERKISREQAKKLAMDGMIINVDASKYINNGKIEIVLRGIGCELKKLPVVLVDANGKAIDTTKTDQTVEVRAVRLSKPGILYNDEEKTKKIFKAGDYMVCLANGKISIMKSEEAANKMHVSSSSNVIGDNYAKNSSKYSFEFLGSPRSKLNEQMIYKWRIVEISNKA